MKGTIRQQELDHIQGVASDLTASKADLPKGLNQQTLNQITQFMKSQAAPLSAEEAAEGIGIARVTARRYLDYLQKTEQVKIIIEYGSIGRPINRYQWM